MSDKYILDHAALTAPIEESKPCGYSKESGENIDLLNAFSKLQLDGQTARKIERARAEVEMLPPQDREDVYRDYAGRADDPRQEPGWGYIADQCAEILTRYSKDTRVLVWLFESMLRVNNFAGLAEAFRICTNLLDQYGTSIYPEAESAEEPEFALQFLDGLNSSRSLLDGILRVSFSEYGQFHYFSYLAAGQLESLAPEQRQEMRDSGALAYEDFDRAIRDSDKSDLKRFAASITTTIAEARSADDILNRLSGKMHFGFSTIIAELEKVQKWFAELAEAKLADEAASSGSDESADLSDGEASGSNGPGTATAVGGGVSVSSVIESREQALKSLLKVAEYFRKTEPHSPLSYALEQAVRWGRMSLPELLKELLDGSDALDGVFRRVGIRENDENDGG
ncbi:MAG: type VI secretion system protein TssA [Pirellulales bacterium]